MTKKKDSFDYLIYGEDAQLAAEFASKLNKVLFSKRISFLRKMQVRSMRELSYEASTEYVEHFYSGAAESIEESVESRLMWEAIRQYLPKLTPKECEVMISIYIQHLTEGETAAKLHVAKSTVSTHKRNAINKICKEMEGK